jgi:hypothetical protein
MAAPKASVTRARETAVAATVLAMEVATAAAAVMAAAAAAAVAAAAATEAAGTPDQQSVEFLAPGAAGRDFVRPGCTPTLLIIAAIEHKDDGAEGGGARWREQSN